MLAQERVVGNLDLKEIHDTVSYDDFTSRMRWMDFSEDDMAVLREVKDLARGYADEVIDELYQHFLGHPETRKFFEDPQTLDYVKRMQREYFLRLTEGPYERDYMADRLKIGAVHERIGLDMPWYLGAYVRYMRSVATRIFDAYEGDHKRALAAYFPSSEGSTPCGLASSPNSSCMPSGPPGPGWSSSTSPACPASTATWPVTWCRPWRLPASWAPP
jgi:Protoglobin